MNDVGVVSNEVLLASNRHLFGIRLRGLRLERGLTCEDLAAKVGNISRSALATIERGKRQAGAKVGERLANALGLTGNARQEFIVAALKTTASQVLPQSAAGLSPDFYVASLKWLSAKDIKPKDIKLNSTDILVSRTSPSAVRKAARKLAEQAEWKAQRIRNALDGTEGPFKIDHLVETQDGRFLLMECLTGEGD